MQPAVLIRLRPAGPWRSGPGEGGRDHADARFGSDRLFSAVTLAMRQLGALEEWLDATARSSSAPVVAFSSLFPFGSDGLYAPPPATLWPPPPAQVTAPSPVFLTKLRWNAAKLVPVSLVESILLGQNVLADQWLPEAQTGCLLRRDRPSSSPFRLTTRTSAAVDRGTQAGVHVHSTACVEFESGAGLWTVARFTDEAARSQWGERIQAAFRLVADSGLGGRRSSGWGQVQSVDFQTGTWPGVLMPKLARRLQAGGSDDTTGYWLLSLYSPGPADAVDWKGGDYALAVRGGFVHGTGQPKKLVRLVTEGSVLAAKGDLAGAAIDVAPEGTAHPVYRAGFALSLRLPVIEIAPQKKTAAVETPSDQEAIETESGETPSEVEEAMPVTGEPEQGLAPEPDVEISAETDVLVETEDEREPEPPEPEPELSTKEVPLQETEPETSAEPERASEPETVGEGEQPERPSVESSEEKTEPGDEI